MIIRRLLPSSILCLALVINNGCARKFQGIDIGNYKYANEVAVGDSLKVGYKMDVQADANNYRYSRKEKRKSIYSVAIKIENVSSKPITLTPANFQISSANGVPKTIYSPEEYSSQIKQSSGSYLLHTLWGPYNLSWSEDTDGKTHFSFLIIPVGLFVGIGNAVRASKANSANLEAHQQSKIWNKEIPPHESLLGLVSLKMMHVEELKFTYNPQIQSEIPSSTAIIDGPFRPAVQPYASYVYKFFVRLTDEKSSETLTRIETSSKPHTMKINVDGVDRVVKPAETKSISRLTPEGTQLLGTPADSCWLFPVITGKINAYFFLSTEDHQSISHIQKGNGAILPLSPRALKMMIGPDPELDKLLFKQDYIAVIKKYNQKY